MTMSTISHQVKHHRRIEDIARIILNILSRGPRSTTYFVDKTAASNGDVRAAIRWLAINEIVIVVPVFGRRNKAAFRLSPFMHNVVGMTPKGKHLLNLMNAREAMLKDV